MAAISNNNNSEFAKALITIAGAFYTGQSPLAGQRPPTSGAVEPTQLSLPRTEGRTPQSTNVNLAGPSNHSTPSAVYSPNRY